MERIFSRILYELEEKRDMMLVTIVSDRGSAPRGAGSQMLVGVNGRLVGTIGGGAVEAASEKLASELLIKKSSAVKQFNLHKSAQDNVGMLCGGEVSVFFQYIPGESRMWKELAAAVKDNIAKRIPGWLVLRLDGSAPSLLDSDGKAVIGEGCEGAVSHKMWLPLPEKGKFFMPLPIGERAVIFGAGHCAQALAPLLTTVGFRVTVYDERPEYANRERFPNADGIINASYLKIADNISLQPEDYVVVMTSGHSFDLEVQDQVLRLPLSYVGVIGSKSKKAAVNAKLKARGISDEAIASVHSPIGTAIKAVTPEEIAVSIAGEMIYERALHREGAGMGAEGCPMSNPEN